MAKILMITTDDQGESLIPLFESLHSLGFAAVLELSWNGAVRRLERRDKFGAILSSKRLRLGNGGRLLFNDTTRLLNQARRSFPKIRLAVIASGFTASELVTLHRDEIDSFRLDNVAGVRQYCELLVEPD